jgi:hypothetical protein
MSTPLMTLRTARTARTVTAAWKNAAEVSTPFRIVGLDGVRAIAVTLVILFHLTPGTTVGGYLGVDIFFVVSGFLITSLLLRSGRNPAACDCVRSGHDARDACCRHSASSSWSAAGPPP